MVDLIVGDTTRKHVGGVFQDEFKTAHVKYAQRTDSLYVTILLKDAEDVHIDLSATNLTFTGKSNEQPYRVQLEFFKEIDTESSVWNVLPFSIQMKLGKKKKGEPFWPRLLKDKALEKTNVTVDWDRYVLVYLDLLLP